MVEKTAASARRKSTKLGNNKAYLDESNGKDTRVEATKGERKREKSRRGRGLDGDHGSNNIQTTNRRWPNENERSETQKMKRPKDPKEKK
jgi:hypothetical protein